MRLQKTMNKTIAVLLEHCRCSEKGTNIIAGIKCIYRRKHGIDVGTAKPASALVLDEVKFVPVRMSVCELKCVFFSLQLIFPPTLNYTADCRTRSLRSCVPWKAASWSSH